MAQTPTKLTDTKIKALPAPQQGQVEHPDTEVPGLRVRIGTSGTKTFILRKRAAGKMNTFTLGRFDPVRFNIADARRRARMLASDIEATGIVSPKVKAKPSTGLTLRAMVPDYIAYVRDEKRNRSWAETERIFNKDILPVLGDRFADTITRGDAEHCRCSEEL